MKPSSDLAYMFAVMLKAGLPAGEAIVYFFPEADPVELKHALSVWQRSKEVQAATLKLLGKPWQDMTLEEQERCALDYHYAGLAHFLYSNNYADLGPQDRAKADAARSAIESKLAGTAGKVDELTAFFSDVRSGKVKLARPAAPVAALVAGPLNGRTDS